MKSAACFSSQSTCCVCDQPAASTHLPQLTNCSVAPSAPPCPQDVVGAAQHTVGSMQQSGLAVTDLLASPAAPALSTRLQVGRGACLGGRACAEWLGAFWAECSVRPGSGWSLYLRSCRGKTCKECHREPCVHHLCLTAPASACTTLTLAATGGRPGPGHPAGRGLQRVRVRGGRPAQRMGACQGGLLTRGGHKLMLV